MDLHDTFWWPTWGKKWRREQFTAEQFRLLTVIFGSLPGPFMMFTGGERGIEDLLPLLRALKDRPEWRGGAMSWWTGEEVPDAVFGLTRSLGGESTTVLVQFRRCPGDGGDSSVHVHALEPEGSVHCTAMRHRAWQQARRHRVILRLPTNESRWVRSAVLRSRIGFGLDRIDRGG